MKKYIALFGLVAFIFACATRNKVANNTKGSITNPITPGYYADPSIIKEGDTYYIYATIDPWGGEELAVLETKDFKQFTPRHLNWLSRPEIS